MKIAVNTRFLFPSKLEGIGWFTHEIFRRLVEKHPEVEWLFLFDRPYAPEFHYSPAVKPLVISPPARHPLLWHIWFQYRLPAILRKENAQLLVSPDGFIPLRSSCPSLSVIHDLNFEHQPENLPRLAGWYMRRYFPLFARHARRVATVSDYSRQDLVQTYRLDPKTIDITYNGVNEQFHPLEAPEIQAERAARTQGKPYFVFIGALNPRKNIEGLLEAYRLYRQQAGAAELVVVGEKMFWNESLESQYQDHPYRTSIHFTGRLQGPRLNTILGAAQALFFVSHFEGFGIPILEAFRCGVPVITATNSSMPEIAGEAALLCDSRDYPSIAQAMRRTDDPSLRKQLIRKGLLQVQEFSWDRSAQRMWQSIQAALQP